MRLVTDVFEFCAARAPEVEHDLDLGLPHARGRGDRGPGAGVHPGRRDRLRRGGRRARARCRRLRRPPSASSSPPGRSCSRRSPSSGSPAGCGPTIMRERFGATEPALAAVPVPRPDGRLEPDRPVDRQQRRADHGPGARRGPRRRPEPAHELARRGARPADRGGRPARAPDPADPGLRGRRDRDARPAGGLVLRREPDQRARGGRLGVSRRDRGDGRHARGDRRRLPAAPDPGGRLPRPAGDRDGRPDRRRGQPLPR